MIENMFKKITPSKRIGMIEWSIKWLIFLTHKY